MFSVEIKINGALISHLYGRNTGETLVPNVSKYDWHLYNAETGVVEAGITIHHRSSGLDQLVWQILDKVLQDREDKEMKSMEVEELEFDDEIDLAS